MRRGVRVIADHPLRGYAQYLLHEWTESDKDTHRKTTTRYIYEVPPEVGSEMIAKGARKDE